MPTTDQPVVGLVLSGGGARSSFQIGALRYLYDTAGITPTVITGTSAGAILGTVIAQSGDHEGQRARLAQLEELWRQMRSSSDMFEELPWFARLRERGPVWLEAYDRRKRRQGALGRSFRRVADLRHGVASATDRTVGTPEEPVEQTVEETEEVATAVAAGVAATSPASGRATLVAPAGQGATEHTESSWVPAKLLESIETLRTVGRAGSDLAEIVEGAQRERSMFRPGPIVDRLLDPEVFEQSEVARSGITLRIAVVALESGELRFVTEDGTLVDRDNRSLPEEPVDLVEAVRASCAIPMVFPPVRLGAENYVDGGVRESLPVDIAQAHLGVTECYAVVAGPSTGVAREESYDDKDMLSIVMRTTTMIMTDEVQRDEVVHAKASGAVVIEPEFDVHDTLTIESGLVSIAIDYGYLRAAEAHRGATGAQQALTRDLITLRRDIWRAEERAFAPDAAAHDEQERLQQVAEITGLKFQLRDLLRALPADHLPESAERWWRGWEQHDFDIPVAPAWAPPA